MRSSADTKTLRAGRVAPNPATIRPLVVSVAFAIWLCLAMTAAAWAANEVVIESKTVPIGAKGVIVGVYVTNDVSITSLMLPLEIRSLTGGAYFTDTIGLSAVIFGRVAVWLWNPFEPARTTYFANPAPSNTCSGPQSSTWTVGSTYSTTLGVSPDAISWWGWAESIHALPAGSDGSPGSGSPCFVISFDVNEQPGQFEIDTCCAAPSPNHLNYGLPFGGGNAHPAFTKGTVTIVPTNRVTIESKTVEAGTHDVSLGLSLSNDVALDEITVPLVARSLSGGAFWDVSRVAVDTLPWTGRLATGALPIRTLDRSSTDGITPDLLALTAAGNQEQCLQPGPPEPSITLTFDVGGSVGAFEIDTAFMSPYGGLSFHDCLNSNSVVPTFVPGVVSVVPTADSSFERIPLPELVGGASVNDFDLDEDLDVMAITSNGRIGVFYGDGKGNFSQPILMPSSDYLYLAGTYAGFANNDRYPDVIALSVGHFPGYEQELLRSESYFGRGDRAFASPVVSVVDPWFMATGVLTFKWWASHVNRDAYLDLVTEATDDARVSTLRVLLGGGDGTFAPATGGIQYQSPSGSSFGFGDMNGDGNPDLLIGTTSLALYLGDDLGGFTFSDSVHIGDSVRILAQSSVADNTLDFNSDGNADVLVTARAGSSAGAGASIYWVLGDGAGHIQVFSSTPLGGSYSDIAVADFNYDGILDLAGAAPWLPRVDFYLGDGAGTFRPWHYWPTNSTRPGSLALGDLRKDGRWDILAVASASQSAVFLSKDPAEPVVDSQMVTYGLDDVRLKITNPLDQSIYSLGNRIPGAWLAYRDADSNGVLDQQITDLNLQVGYYVIDVWKVPDADPNGHYTLAIGIDAHQEVRVLARNALLPPAGVTFHFAFPYGSTLEVEPPTGTFVSSTQPTFDWSTVTASAKQAERYEFDLDDFWDFATPEIRDTNVSEPRFTPGAPLLNDTLYYWRFRAFDGSTWGQYSATYVVNTLPPCDCPSQGDIASRPTGDGVIDVFDVIEVIGIAFSGSPDIQDPLCPTTRGDVDNNGVVDVFDVIYLIATAFTGGPNPVDPCAQ